MSQITAPQAAASHKPDRGDQIDHREEYRSGLPGDGTILERVARIDADAADARPMVEALEHRHAGHHAQEQHQPSRPAADGLFTLPLVHRLEALQIVLGERLVHGSSNSSAPSGAKWRSTSAALTSASVAGCQRGALSLSIITARTPS